MPDAVQKETENQCHGGSGSNDRRGFSAGYLFHGLHHLYTDPGINLSLPESSTAEPVAASRIVITVAGEEEIYINKERVTLDGLVPILQGMRESSDIGNVVLEGDRQVPYAMLIQVLDRLRAAGFSGANLRTLEPGGG